MVIGTENQSTTKEVDFFGYYRNMTNMNVFFVNVLNRENGLLVKWNMEYFPWKIDEDEPDGDMNNDSE